MATLHLHSIIKTADVIDGDDWTEKGSKGSVKKENADTVDDRVDQTYKKTKDRC